MIPTPLRCARRIAASHATLRAPSHHITARLPLLLIGPLLLVQTTAAQAALSTAAAPSPPSSAAKRQPRSSPRTRSTPSSAADTCGTPVSPLHTAQTPLPEQLDGGYKPQFDMAWECSGMSNSELVENLVRGRIVKTQPVYDAMRAVDRALFIPGRTHPALAYQDSPQTIGFGATISAPHMHAMCLELLVDKLKPGCRALDIGSGSGYLVAAMASMIASGGKKPPHEAERKTAEAPAAAAAAAAAAPNDPSTATASTGELPSVVGIEHIQELVEMSQAALLRWSPHHAAATIQLLQGDGRLGMQGQQFDAIHVGAAAERIPESLLQQLKPGGRLVIPVGRGSQHLLCVDKDAHGELHQRVVTGVRYVPLTDEQKQRGAAW